MSQNYRPRRRIEERDPTFQKGQMLWTLFVVLGVAMAALLQMNHRANQMASNQPAQRFSTPYMTSWAPTSATQSADMPSDSAAGRIPASLGN